MGLTVGDTTAPRLNQQQRKHLLGQCTHLNVMSWEVAEIQSSRRNVMATLIGEPSFPRITTSYTFSQPLPVLEELLSLSPSSAPNGRNPRPEGPNPRHSRGHHALSMEAGYVRMGPISRGSPALLIRCSTFPRTRPYT
jgi:hypothetical protein